MAGTTAARASAGHADLLGTALAAAGGRTRLARVQAIGWRGAAEVVTPERRLTIGVETHVEPFVRARTDSWIGERRPETIRSIRIEPAAGFVERGGIVTPMPRIQERHEREQFALYGYMLLADAPIIAVDGRLRAARAGLPPIVFDVADDGRLAAADFTVVAPDGGPVINERFIFDGMIADAGIRWPRRIRIAQDGAPFFTMVIDRLTVTLR